MRYALGIDAKPMVRLADEPETVDALFVLIEARTGMERIAAENLLNTGMLIISKGLMVVRTDLVEKIHGISRAAAA